MQRFEKEENAKVLSCFPSTIRGNSEAAAADGWQEIKKEGISLFLMKTFTRQSNRDFTCDVHSPYHTSIIIYSTIKNQEIEISSYFSQNSSNFIVKYILKK